MSEPQVDSASSTEASSTQASLAALQTVVSELEEGAARVGWDRGPSLYALVPMKELIEAEGVPADILASLKDQWDGGSEQLAAVAQETVSTEDLEELLPTIVWPESVQGAALTVERIVLPTQVEQKAPEGVEEAENYAQTHPERTDIRVVVGVNRAGQSWCEVRARSFDNPEDVVKGPLLVPGLVEALKLGFAAS